MQPEKTELFYMLLPPPSTHSSESEMLSRAAVEYFYLKLNINGRIWGISLNTAVLQQSA